MEPFDKRKLITVLVPAVLILLILGISVTAQVMKKNSQDKDSTQQLQEAIKDYADAVGSTDTAEQPVIEDADGTGKEDPDLSVTDTSPVPVEDSDRQVSGDVFGANTGDASGFGKPAGSPTTKKLYENVKFDQQSQLAEMQYYWDDNNQKALDDLAFLDHFKAMSYALRGTNDFYYYGGKDAAGRPSGQGIAVYGDNKYYYGSWADGVRSGEGTFLHYHIYEEPGSTDVCSYHFYRGAWREDRPNGAGSEHYEFNLHNLQPGIGYNSNLIGTYQKGLYNGDFYITNLYSDGNVKEWDASAVAGVFDYQSANKDTMSRRAVQVDRTNSDNYIWMSPKDNKNLGVPCLNESGSVK